VARGSCDSGVRCTRATAETVIACVGVSIARQRFRQADHVPLLIPRGSVLASLLGLLLGGCTAHHEEPDRRRQTTPATTAMARMIQTTM
jgi:hypothetical protein